MPARCLPTPKPLTPCLACAHLPFDRRRTQVQRLLECVWNGPEGFRGEIPDLEAARNHAMEQIRLIRPDTVRPLNPTPYKVSVSQDLYTFLHGLWLEEMPIHDLE